MVPGESLYKKSTQRDFALQWKLWPANFGEHFLIFAGNSRSTGISQLRSGKTRSKRPLSHCLSTVHLLPYMWASFYPLDPSRYLSSFLSWRSKTMKFPFFHEFPWPLAKNSSACCGLTFDATDLIHSSFEPLYPKVFRGTPWVDLVSIVWPPDLSKVRLCPYSAAEKCCF